MPKPQTGDHGTYFDRYINLVQTDDCVKGLQDSMGSLNGYLDAIPAAKADYAYGEGKWPVKQVLQHIIDAERIFGYRALCISRGEQQSLPGFDENSYADHATAGGRSLQSLVAELKRVRQSTIDLFASFTPEQLDAKGVSNNTPTKANSLGFMILGHWLHHEKILKERYGV